MAGTVVKAAQRVARWSIERERTEAGGAALAYLVLVPTLANTVLLASCSSVDRDRSQLSSPAM
jgi:hypothetical protein